MDPGDDPLLVDQDEGAIRRAVVLQVGAVGTRNLALGVEISEERNLDAEVVAECLVGPRVVDADSEQRGTPLFDLREYLLVDRELVRADRAEVGREEDQHDLAAAEVHQRYLLAVLVAEREVGRLRPDFDHVIAGPFGPVPASAATKCRRSSSA